MWEAPTCAGSAGQHPASASATCCMSWLGVGLAFLGAAVGAGLAVLLFLKKGVSGMIPPLVSQFGLQLADVIPVLQAAATRLSSRTPPPAA